LAKRHLRFGKTGQIQYQSNMTTTLGANGQIDIPKEIREVDHLVAGDSFQLKRLDSGKYLLDKEPRSPKRFELSVGADGLPIIKAEGIITSAMVKEIESQGY
jgi:AbrB family looped-hinge helix DNA binding protein